MIKCTGSKEEDIQPPTVDCWIMYVIASYIINYTLLKWIDPLHGCHFSGAEEKVGLTVWWLFLPVTVWISALLGFFEYILGPTILFLARTMF